MDQKKRHPGGRPTKYRRDFHPESFIAHSKQGKTLAQIAFAWDVDRDTVHEWAKVHPEFSVAIKKGRQFAEAWYQNLGHSAMLGRVMVDGKPAKFNLGVYVWLTKNMFRWSDKIETRNADDFESPRPLKDLSDEELDKLNEDTD